MNDVIIFGGSGFIGSHLIKHLNTNGVIPLVCDIIEKPLLKNLRYNFRCIDVRKPFDIDLSDKNVSIIYNLAAISKSPGHEPQEYYETNINGAKNISNFAEEKNINTIIFTSTIAVYGYSESPCLENSPLNADSDYGLSKIQAEKVHIKWFENNKNRNLIILRPGVVYGYKENSNFHRLYKAIKRGLFFYPGRKDTLKSCIYVKDLVSISYNLIKQEKFQIFNMCYNKSFSIEKIVYTISSICNFKIPKSIIPSKFLIILAFLINKITVNKLGFHPERVKKVMLSTNVSGQKLQKLGFNLMDFELSIKDWYKDSESKGLL